MLNTCNNFATEHGLTFNPNKTQLICFRRFKLITNPPVIRFQNVTLKYMDAVKIILHHKLDDGPDIVRAIKDLNKKAISMLYTFRSADPVVKTFLIKMYCLSLYGCHTWSLSSKCLFQIQVAMNKILGSTSSFTHFYCSLHCRYSGNL